MASDRREFWGLWVGRVGPLLLSIFAIFTSDFWKQWAAVAFAVLFLSTIAVPELPELRISKRTIRLGLFALLLTGFLVHYTYPAPLITSSIVTPNTYATGAEISGVKFLPPWTDARINLENQSGRNYEDVEVRVSSDMNIEGIGQISSISGVDFVGHKPLGELQQRDSQGKIMSSVPLFQPTSEATIRIKTFPKHSTLELIVALSRQASDPGQYLDHSRPCMLKVDSEFTAWRRTRTLSRELEIVGTSYNRNTPLELAMLDRMNCTVGSINMTLREVVNGKTNVVEISTPHGHFLFDPVRKIISFGRTIEKDKTTLSLPILERADGKHMVFLSWDDSRGGMLSIDGEIQQWGEPILK
jgi:hypothetical protein